MANNAKRNNGVPEGRASGTNAEVTAAGNVQDNKQELTPQQKAIAIEVGNGLAQEFKALDAAQATVWGHLCELQRKAGDRLTWNAAVAHARALLASEQLNWSASTFGQYVSTLGLGLMVNVVAAEGESRPAFDKRRKEAEAKAGKGRTGGQSRQGRQAGEGGDGDADGKPEATPQRPVNIPAAALGKVLGEDGKPVTAFVDAHAPEGSRRSNLLKAWHRATVTMDDDQLEQVVRVTEAFSVISPDERGEVMVLVEQLESAALDRETPAADAADAAPAKPEAGQPQQQQAVG